ncbi:MAG: hypothetical protein WC404_07560 [Candidatus Omnitrophota bacterium]|jgi:hypothetical protein
MKAFAQFGSEIQAETKRVYYEGSSTIYEGMPLCYNQDTTDNITGWSKSSSAVGTTTAEGYQNEGKYLRVEDPASGNLLWLAGYVVGGGWVGKAEATWLEIYVPNGAIIPVRTNKNCTIGDELGLASGTAYLAAPTGDGDPLPCAVAMETVDRSGTNGLVLAKVFPTGQPVSALGGYFAPTRGAATGDAYGIRIDLDNLFTSSGATGPRTWGVGITGDRAVDYAVITAGADDAGLRINISNYAPNEEVFNWRGINVVANNRDGGTVGELDNIISVSAKQGSTNATIVGLKVDTQSLSADTADELGGLDVALNREGGVSTVEYGVQIRTRGTINTAINSAIRISKDATDHGFINLLNIETDAVDVTAATGNTAHDTSDICIPVVFNGDTFYIVAQDSLG